MLTRGDDPRELRELYGFTPDLLEPSHALERSEERPDQAAWRAALLQIYQTDRARMAGWAARRTLDPHTALELVQHAFVVALERDGPPDDPRAYVWGILKKLTLKAVQRAGRVVWLDDPSDLERLAEPSRSVADPALESERSRLLVEELERLTPLQQEVVIRIGVRGESAVEVARALSRSADAIRQVFRRALETLRSRASLRRLLDKGRPPDSE
jgi:RNA polymerase sigma factor (sigma-70 family)